MSDLFMEMSLLTELSDEQQEVLAGGRLGDAFELSNLPEFPRMNLLDPLNFGNLWEPDTHNDDSNCHRTEEKDGNAEVIRIVCEKTERTP